MSEVFGRYLLERKLGAGGMGEVRLARQMGPDGFDRRCVVKRMHLTLAHDETLVRLFLEEARLTASLNHPHIAQVYDFGKIDGRYYLAMERVEGASLRELIDWHRRQSRLVPVPFACRVVSQAARALEYAHTATDADGQPLNVVHRDVSPSNVLVSLAGSVKLIDFGIAHSAVKTATIPSHSVRGKVDYVSPEQVRGETVDGRSDLYSLGLVLFELLTLERAASASGLESTLRARRPDLATAVLAVVLRATEREPSRRFQTSMAFAEAIDALGSNTTDAELGALVKDVAAELDGSTSTVTTPASACPSDGTLERFSRGDLPEAEAETVRAHLDGCAECLGVVAALAPVKSKSEAPLVGERIGRYVVERLLGSGGMGIVLQAHDPQLDRRVALKLMLWDGSEERRARFLRESQAAARVRHPNVVAVHDVGTHGDESFIAMELIEGPTLREFLERRPSEQQLVELLGGVAAGLSAIHAASVVHRDLKPENVLIDADGRPRITDFGVARALDSELTRTGQVLGTLAYMAPEQLTDSAVGPEADQFAFCAIAYECFTGTRPFSGGSKAALHAAVRSATPAAGWKAVPARLRPILARGLRLAPQERFPSIDALAEALRAASRRRAGAGWWIAAAVVLMIGATALLVSVTTPAATTLATDVRSPTLEVEQAPEPRQQPVPKQPEPERPSEHQPEASLTPPIPQPTVATKEKPRPTAKTRPAKVVEATKAAGTLSVSTTPPMEVLLDDQSLGTSPLSRPVPIGVHQLVLRANDLGLKRDEKVQIEAEKTAIVSWNPQRIELGVRSTPPDVEFEISVDGHLVGETPLKSFSLWEGRHRVRVKSTSGWEHEERIDVRPSSKRVWLRDGEGIELLDR